MVIKIIERREVIISKRSRFIFLFIFFVLLQLAREPNIVIVFWCFFNL
jgi:hypothetical protein